MAYVEYAAALVELDDVTHYEKLRDAALKIYGDATNTATAERMLTVSLLLPVNAKQLSVLEKLAELAARSNPTDKKLAPWAYTALALFEYRRGHFEQSAEWSRKALSFGEFSNRSPRTHLLLAMAWFQLKQVEQARAELAPVRKIMADKLTGNLGVGEWAVGYWHDWIINRILLREALKLTGSPPSEQ
jgi:tetratricopeptide (TPR) repeat protein